MNEDPTRLMDYGEEPPRRHRPPQQPKGNLRLVVLIMGVVIFGLLIGLIASCGGGAPKTSRRRARSPKKSRRKRLKKPPAPKAKVKGKKAKKAKGRKKAPKNRNSGKSKK